MNNEARPSPAAARAVPAMARCAASRYSSRNLDACLLQLGSWTPFLAPPSPLVTSDASSFPAPDHAGWRREDRAPFLPSPKLQLPPSATPAPVPHLVRCAFKQVAGAPSTLDVRFRCRTSEKVYCVSSWSLRAQSRQPAGNRASIVAAAAGVSDSSEGDAPPCSLPHLPNKHSSGWSRRQKQLSRALARGLWRWKEGSRARKRRRRVGTSCSGSGRSSGHGSRMYASDPPTVGASAAYATCSDFPFAGTDSSGELFLCGDVNGGSWESEFYSLNEGIVYRRDGGEPYLSDAQNNVESGYGSEPGYRGGDELGYEDDGLAEEQDEEEPDSAMITTWSAEVVTDAGMEDSYERTMDPEAFDEELACSRISNEQKMLHHRLRRRKQDWKLPNAQKSRLMADSQLKDLLLAASDPSRA